MPNEAEFQAYYVLTHAWSNDVVSRCEKLSREVFLDPKLQLALHVRSLMARTNEDRIQGRPTVCFE